MNEPSGNPININIMESALPIHTNTGEEVDPVGNLSHSMGGTPKDMERFQKLRKYVPGFHSSFHLRKSIYTLRKGSPRQ